MVCIQFDLKYFDLLKINFGQLEYLLCLKVVLMFNVMVEFDIEGSEKKVWCYQNGMVDYLVEMMVGQLVVLIFVSEKYVEVLNGFVVGEGVIWVLVWFEEGGGKLESYVNLILMFDGGIYEVGLKVGVFEVIKSFVDYYVIFFVKVKLVQEDVCGWMIYLFLVKVFDL